MKKLKPRIDYDFKIDKLNPASLEYFCLTDEIDRIVMERKKKTYNPELATKNAHFIITSDARIGVVFDKAFLPWKEKNNVQQPERSEKATKVIEWFIKEVHKI